MRSVLTEDLYDLFVLSKPCFPLVELALTMLTGEKRCDGRPARLIHTFEAMFPFGTTIITMLTGESVVTEHLHDLFVLSKPCFPLVHL